MNKSMFIGGGIIIVTGAIYTIATLCKFCYTKGYVSGAKDMTIESIKIMAKDTKKDK